MTILNFKVDEMGPIVKTPYASDDDINCKPCKGIPFSVGGSFFS